MQFNDKFDAFLEYLRAIGRSNKTVGEYSRFIREIISEAVGNIEIKDFKITDDIAKIIHIGRKHGKYGPQRAVCNFRVFWRYLYDSGYKDILPYHWRDIKIPKSPPGPGVEFLTPNEFEELLNCFDLTKIEGLRQRALIEMIVSTGMRIAEALGVNRKDVNWKTGDISIINCKTKAPEIVRTTDRGLVWLKRYMEARLDDEPCMFRGNDGGALTYTSAKGYFRRVSIDLQMKKTINSRILRKTFITWLSEGGMEIKQVQAKARHKSEITTMKHYIGLSSRRANDKHQQVFRAMLSPEKVAA